MPQEAFAIVPKDTRSRCDRSNIKSLPNSGPFPTTLQRRHARYEATSAIFNVHPYLLSIPPLHTVKATRLSSARLSSARGCPLTRGLEDQYLHHTYTCYGPCCRNRSVRLIRLPTPIGSGSFALIGSPSKFPTIAACSAPCSRDALALSQHC